MEIQNNEARNVGRKEKQELKEQITDDLLPRAFTRSSRTQAIFDTRHGYLLVNNAASAKAENILTKLREALGGLEAALPNTKQSPSSLMTSWLLQGHCEGGFELDSDCELKGVGDVVPVVKVSKQDLTADEVVQHVKTAKPLPSWAWYGANKSRSSSLKTSRSNASSIWTFCKKKRKATATMPPASPLPRKS